METGNKTGFIDGNGVEVKCGDTVSFFEYREGYVERHSEDGWGRSITLCRHDQYKVEEKTKTITGTVKYDKNVTGFIVEFDDFMLDSGRKTQNLYMLKSGKDIVSTTKLLVI